MKVIVISGASSRVGKTTLAARLHRVLAGSHVVKIGHGPRKSGVENHFYEWGTPFQTIRENHGDADWLIVESNSVLREIQPDLVIYLEGDDPKPSAQEAKRRADIISTRAVGDEDVAALAVRLAISVDLTQTIVHLVQDLGARQSGA